MSIGSYYALVDLGLRGATTKYIAQYEAVKDHEKVNTVFITSLGTYFAIALLPLVLSAGVAWIFPFVIDTPPEMVAAARWSILIIGCTVALRILGQVGGASLVALKRFDVSNLLSTTTQIIRAVLIIYIVWNGGGLVAMALCTLGFAVIDHSTETFVAVRLLGGIRFSRAYFDFAMLKELGKFGSLNIVIHLTRRIADYAGAVIVGIVLGPASVAYYAIAEGLQRKSMGLSQSIVSVVMPVASQLQSQRRQVELTRIFVLVPRLLLVMGLLVATVFIIMGPAIIEIWLGNKYIDPVTPVLSVLALALVLRMPSNGLRSLLTGMGRMAFLSKVAAVEAIVFVVLGSCFVWFFGLIGVAWAMLLSQAFTTALALPIYTCALIEYPLRRFLWKTIVPAVLAIVPGLLIAVAINAFIPPTTVTIWMLEQNGITWQELRWGGLMELLVHAAVVTAVTACCSLYVCLSADVRGDILRSLKLKRQPARRIEPDTSVAPAFGQQASRIDGVPVHPAKPASDISEPGTAAI